MTIAAETVTPSPPPTHYTPRWFFILETIENTYRAKTCEPVPKVGTLFTSPNYPYWDIGNCLYIDLEHPEATDVSLAEMEAAATHAQAKLNALFSNNPRTPFYMTIDPNPTSPSHRRFRHWELVLGTLGYEATSGHNDDDASHCMTFHRNQLPLLQSLAATCKQHVVTFASLQDLQATIDNEPGSQESLGWRTEKCRELLGRPASVSRTYLCWEDAEVAVSRFMLVRDEKDPCIAFIPRVNTRVEYRRNGYAKSVLVHGLLDAFNKWPNLEEVALFQGELGPERLYESIGMVKRATRMDVEFQRQKRARK
ncbi:hypothetical protein DYB26_016123 [Aphanomyces astaci]|uniref:N-acetyltransferase domain-containing protein n=1 Tax=Aphanomyces astaci TaxID=112090 RepID=A0A397CJ52_APHAT|nr:hypothetical protein DYB36_011092 [Aphanomyces astaci]RHY43927.1 hypothetical protein DYB38_013370 [Aphanomyces astaci]RHY73810.1 hypothetical protein DYB34_013528 [Aphanomyces astaci]RHZ39722.1 hypothetical protein DYB26_016123 [Aphanomyces astaci]